jgi:hypothetical protein
LHTRELYQQKYVCVWEKDLTPVRSGLYLCLTQPNVLDSYLSEEENAEYRMKDSQFSPVIEITSMSISRSIPGELSLTSTPFYLEKLSHSEEL